MSLQPPPRELLETYLQRHMPFSEVIAKEYGTEVIARDSQKGVCDFCSERRNGPEDGTIFEVDDVWVDTGLAGMPPYFSRGGWAACDMCATLIRANTAESREALYRWCVKQHKKKYPDLDPTYFNRTLGAAQRAFWSVYDKRAI